MDEGIAVRRQQLADLEEILVKMSDADMLHHADRNHPVKPAGELAIVQLTKRDVIRNAGGLGMIACRLDLLGRNIDRGDIGDRFARQKPPQPEPISATVMPGFNCSLLVAWISLLRCACSSVSCSGSRK